MSDIDVNSNFPRLQAFILLRASLKMQRKASEQWETRDIRTSYSCGDWIIKHRHAFQPLGRATWMSSSPSVLHCYWLASLAGSAGPYSNPYRRDTWH